MGAAQTDARLEIELCDAVSHRPVRVAFVEDGKIKATDGANAVDVGEYKPGVAVKIVLAVLGAGRFTVQVDGKETKTFAVAEKDCGSVERLSLRTGKWRGCGGGGEVDAKLDVLRATPAVFQVNSVTVRPLP